MLAGGALPLEHILNEASTVPAWPDVHVQTQVALLPAVHPGPLRQLLSGGVRESVGAKTLQVMPGYMRACL